MKKFHIGDVLSVTTGRLLSPRHMDGVYDILSFMTGHALLTHQLPRAQEVCAPALLTRFPRLAEAPVGDVRDQASLETYLKGLVGAFGEYLDVEPLAPGLYTYMDPVQELKQLVSAANAAAAADSAPVQSVES